MVEKDLTGNILRVAQGNRHDALYCGALACHEIQWVNDPPALPCQLAVKVRYRQADQIAMLAATDEGYSVVFDAPQRAVTPGQWVCFYHADVCLGGGIIDSTTPLVPSH